MKAKRSILLATAVLCIAGAAAWAAEDGKTLFEMKCTLCHAAKKALSESKDKGGWMETIGKMKGKGAQVTDAQAEAIADYLAGAAGK